MLAFLKIDATCALCRWCVNVQVGPRPFEWVLTVLLHVAEALSVALAANVVHMDLKTNNIMIDDAVTFASRPVPEWCVA
jgi:hypothetical protein